MRWGVRDEATDDHMTTELCMREIVSGKLIEEKFLSDFLFSEKLSTFKHGTELYYFFGTKIWLKKF